MSRDLTITQYVGQEAVSNNIQQVLKDKTPQFVASVASLVANNEKLKACDNGSILRACLVAASLDLPINPNLGFAYVIPYKDQAQFQMGYKGFVQLAMRSGQFKTLNVQEVKEGEIAEHNFLTGEIKFEWLEIDREKAKTIGYVAYMKLVNGFEKIFYMTKEQLTAHGVKFSKTFKQGFGLWKDDFDSMAKKTMIKLLLSKWGPMTTEMQTAQLADQAIIKGTDSYEYVDNTPIDHEEVSSQKEIDRVLKHIVNAKSLEELKQVDELVTDETRSAYLDKQAELEG